jgi:hypothetical protein
MKGRVALVIGLCLFLATWFLFANHCIRNLTSLAPSLAPTYLSTAKLRIDNLGFSNASYAFLSEVHLSNTEIDGFYLPSRGITLARKFEFKAEHLLFKLSLLRPSYIEVEIDKMSFRYIDAEVMIDNLKLLVPSTSLSPDGILEFVRKFFLDICLKSEVSHVAVVDTASMRFDSNELSSSLGSSTNKGGVWTMTLSDDVVKKYFEDASLLTTERERAIYAPLALDLPRLRRAKKNATEAAFAEYPDDEIKRGLAERTLWAWELALHLGSTGATEVLEASGESSADLEKAVRRGIWLSDTPMSRSQALRKAIY